MNARCEECGSPRRLNHDGKFFCMRDPAHGLAFGGEGSGIKGHVTQRQNHAQAAGAHYAAYQAHKEAAHWLAKPDVQTDTFRGKPFMAHAAVKDTAQSLTKGAGEMTKKTGANPYSVQAARTYAGMAAKAKTPQEAVKWHKEAAKMHKAASHDHEVARKSLPGRGGYN